MNVELTSTRAPYTRAGVRFSSTRTPVRERVSRERLAKLHADRRIGITLLNDDGEPDAELTAATLASFGGDDPAGTTPADPGGPGTPPPHPPQEPPAITEEPPIGEPPPKLDPAGAAAAGDDPQTTTPPAPEDPPVVEEQPQPIVEPGPKENPRLADAGAPEGVTGSDATSASAAPARRPRRGKSAEA